MEEGDDILCEVASRSALERCVEDPDVLFLVNQSSTQIAYVGFRVEENQLE